MLTKSGRLTHRLSLLVFGMIFVLTLWPTGTVRAAVNVLDPRVFEWRFYLQNNADLMVVGKTTRQAAETHWQQQGIREGRQAHPGFHTRQYLDMYADVRNVYGANNFLGALEHYLTYGLAEKRRGFIEKGAYDRWTAKNDRIYVGASARTAGAIDSIFWNNREFINSYDHGRQVQIALSRNQLSECYNPTQAGRDKDGVGFATTSVREAIRSSRDTLFAQTLPAFWVAPGERSEFCPGGAVNTMPVSGYRINTAVRVGYAGLPHAIQFKANILVPEQSDSLLIEMPAVYVAGDFTAFYTYNFNTRKADPISPAPAAGEQKEIGRPVILATPDGNYAISVWSPELPQTDPSWAKDFAYAYGNLRPGANVEHTTKLRATFREGQGAVDLIPAGTNLKYRAYIVVGSLSNVTSTLQALYDKWVAGQLP